MTRPLRFTLRDGARPTLTIQALPAEGRVDVDSHQHWTALSPDETDLDRVRAGGRRRGAEGYRPSSFLRFPISRARESLSRPFRYWSDVISGSLTFPLLAAIPSPIGRSTNAPMVTVASNDWCGRPLLRGSHAPVVPRSVSSQDLAASPAREAAPFRAFPIASAHRHLLRQDVGGDAPSISVLFVAPSFRPAPPNSEMQFSMSECPGADNFCPKSDNADRG